MPNPDSFKDVLHRYAPGCHKAGVAHKAPLSCCIYNTGLPLSGKIREKFDLLESQGKSGNFNIFCRESGEVRENDLAEVTQSLSLISRHIFVKSQ